MLLDLSVELLEAIGTQLPQRDHAVLRQVCKDLNGAVSRLFFSALTLKTSKNGLGEDGVKKLKVLANGETGWSLHARILHIMPAKAANEAHDEKPVDLLAAALGSLLNIKTVVWHAPEQGFWAWGQTVIATFLNALDTLDDLELNISGTINLSTLQVQHLRNFTLRRTDRNWERWRPRHMQMTQPLPSIYQDIAQLVCQNRLTSLHLEGINHLSVVWRTLRSAKSATRMRLTEITTSVVTQDLFDYLTSYSGLEKLTLKFPDGGNVEESNRLADRFFETVLPRHAESLTELSCPAAYQSRFSFGTHNVNVVSLLHKLTKLEMSINAGAVRRVTPPKSFIGPDGKERRVISIGISVEAEQADIDPVVTLLLETAAVFPTLHSLTILSADTERNRGALCGSGRIRHKGAVDAAIGKAVKAFRTDVPCSAIVRAGHGTHELRPLPDEGGLAYEQTGRWSRY
ncbi:hypothetical protein MSAN_01589100 [Mycena sanguinolenta]|uniref:F-box domain-containing protein n=1 Tax=Mycena sanguinolenta TaxID=230812 RepID=A0A8H7CXH3_9AGAR|nr:hypothetical protein MSAN_01589100 [Mycena sanguinolenta]